MSITGSKRAALYNSEDESDYIILRKIAQDSTFRLSGLTAEGLDGSLVYLETRAELLLRFMDDNAITKLRNWMESGVQVKAVIEADSEAIVWDKATTIGFDEPESFEVRQRSKRELLMRAQDSGLGVSKISTFVVTADGQILEGIIGIEDETEVVTVRAFPPASINEEGSITWMGQVIETIMVEAV